MNENTLVLLFISVSLLVGVIVGSSFGKREYCKEINQEKTYHEVKNICENL